MINREDLVLIPVESPSLFLYQMMKYYWSGGTVYVWSNKFSTILKLRIVCPNTEVSSIDVVV